MTSTTVPHDFISFFVCNIEEKVLQSYENKHKFQASVTEKYTSLSKSSGIFQQNPLKVPVKKLNL